MSKKISFLLIFVFSFSLFLFNTNVVYALSAEDQPTVMYKYSSEFIVVDSNGRPFDYSVYKDWPTITFTAVSQSGDLDYLADQNYTVPVSLIPSGYHISMKFFGDEDNAVPGGGGYVWSFAIPYRWFNSLSPIFMLERNTDVENFVDFEYRDTQISSIRTRLYYESNKPLSYSYSFDELPQPLSFTGYYFLGWRQTYNTSDATLYTTRQIYDMYLGGGYYRFEAEYGDVPNLQVSFYDLDKLINTYSFSAGVGTITPPFYRPITGSTLYGWALEPNGEIIDFSEFDLTENTVFFAITQRTSLDGDENFDIPSLDCAIWDIPCHLGNAFVYFLNEFPLVSDIVKLIKPIIDLVGIFSNNIVIFNALGWFFTISIGFLFVCFILRFFE